MTTYSTKQYNIIIQQFALIFRALQSKGIENRDMRLSNFLIKNKNSTIKIKLADLAPAQKNGNSKCKKEFCGTFLYIAPEICLSDKPNEKSDLWTIGMIMYILLTNQFPYTRITSEELSLVLSIGILKFPDSIKLSKDCIDLMKMLLRANPTGRITWEKFFECPFVKKVDFLDYYQNTLYKQF